MDAWTAIIIAALVFIGIFGMFKSFDLRKWSTWFYAFCLLASGLIVGLVKDDFYGGLILGAMFAALALYGASINHWQKRRAEEKADAWLARNEKIQPFPY